MYSSNITNIVYYSFTKFAISFYIFFKKLAKYSARSGVCPSI